MEELLNSSIINGIVFAIYDNVGPHPVYMFPNPIDENAKEDCTLNQDYKKGLKLTIRDFTQIAIKNLSLLIGDGSILAKVDVSSFKHFGIIPFPDFCSTTLTFFHFIKSEYEDLPLATSFSLIVNENLRNFLYNNLDRLKKLVIDFFVKLDKELVSSLKIQEEVSHHFLDLLNKITKIEQEPSTIFSSHRKLKILLAGLDNAGKSSFLLSVDQKYSKLLGLKPTHGAKVSSIQALGATLFLWDLGGQVSLRDKYLNKAHIYLYEADLLFYFIDIGNPSRFKESIEYLEGIKLVLQKFNQNTPIIYIFSKADPDIINSSKIKKNVEHLVDYLNKEIQFEIYFTSIFDPFSILRAFSSGIAKLSPNRVLIEHNLHNFCKQTKVFLGLLMSLDGLILAESYTQKASEITKIDKPEELLSVFELTGPQFAILFQIFSKYRGEPQNEAIFQVANSIIVVKKVSIADFEMFFLFLIDDEKKKELINQNLPTLLQNANDLLLRYIS
jgi:GTPase SAR1 family protein